jgi:hypothetical protein
MTSQVFGLVFEMEAKKLDDHNEVLIPAHYVAVKHPHHCPLRKLYAHHKPLSARKLGHLKLGKFPPDLTMWMIDKLAGPPSPKATQVPVPVPISCSCDAGDPEFTANPVSFEPSAWTKHLDEDKTFYFFNRYTGQSRWEGPVERCAYCKRTDLAKH